MKSRSKSQPKFPQFLFYLKIAGGEVCDRGEDVERWLGASKPQKPLYFRRFSYQSATVGLPIVNPRHHAHGRALHSGARRPVNFKVMVLCGY